MVDAYLLVEGKNDQHIIWALCRQHNLAETFSVECSDQGNHENRGVEQLLLSIPVRLKAARLRTLGIILDADTSAQTRWQAICGRLAQAGYNNLPESPSSEGTIILQLEKPKVGIWIMPDNRLPGMVESFATHLIKEDDPLAVKARSILHEIEGENLQRYLSVHYPKAFIHTWLAWQKTPGQPIGQAITARVLQHDTALARRFVNWLLQLFEPPNSSDPS
jgi:hypothetical protein